MINFKLTYILSSWRSAFGIMYHSPLFLINVTLIFSHSLGFIFQSGVSTADNLSIFHKTISCIELFRILILPFCSFLPRVVLFLGGGLHS